MKRIMVILTVCLVSTNVQAKNVILFIGDGMGISTVTAARIFVGQRQGHPGEEHQLSFDKFHNVALVKTYNTDAQVPDSAGTITAIMSGYKTRRGVIGVSEEVAMNDCDASLRHEVPSLLELAEDSGKATGIVSTTEITHATPAGAYAHTPNRGWDNSSSIGPEARALGCQDIALQLISTPHGDGPDVILGGGRGQFMPREMSDPEHSDKKGKRDDGRNLIADWVGAAEQRNYVWDLESFESALPLAGQVMGLFEPSHMQFEADRTRDPAGEPSLVQMTTAAIDRLAQNENGYFLLVEGGRIDHAHHFGNAYRALVDTAALDDAVAAAVARVDPDETLILVTADHSHTLTISGYPPRGNPILGKVDQSSSPVAADVKALPYTTLGYANGGGYVTPYPDLTEVDTTDPNYRQIAAVPIPIETHAGEDVAAYAWGLNSDSLRGVIEQSAIFEVLAGALFPSGEGE